MESFVRQTRVSILLGAIALAGCGGPDHQAICQEREDCSDGNDKDVEACVAEYDLKEDVAGDLGCSSEYDTYYECFQDAARCKNKSYGVDPNDCEAEHNAYQRCAGNVDVGGH